MEITAIELVLSMIPRGKTKVPLTIDLDQMSVKVRVYSHYDKKALLKKLDTNENLLYDLLRATMASDAGAQEPGMYFFKCHD